MADKDPIPETSGKESSGGLPRPGGDKIPTDAPDRPIPENEGTGVKSPDR